PLMTTPDQPLVTAASAIMSPISAERKDPPPSTTSTAPSPGVLRTCLTRPLSSWHLTVRIGPAKKARPPYPRNCVAQLRKVSPCSPEAEHTPGTPLSYWPVHQGSLAPSSTRVPPLHTHRSFRDPERFKL